MPADSSATSPTSPYRVVSSLSPNSTRTTQTGLSPTFHGIFPNHLDVSRWLKPRNFPVSWSTSATSPKYARDTYHSWGCLGEVGVMELGLDRAISTRADRLKVIKWRRYVLHAWQSNVLEPSLSMSLLATPSMCQWRQWRPSWQGSRGATAP